MIKLLKVLSSGTQGRLCLVPGQIGQMVSHDEIVMDIYYNYFTRKVFMINVGMKGTFYQRALLKAHLPPLDVYNA